MPKVPRSNGSRKGRSASDGTKDGATAVAEQPGFERRPVDEVAEHAPAGPAGDLTDDQRVLLGDLFAVVEEHASDAAEG